MFGSLFARSGLSLDRLRALADVAEAGGIARAVGKDPGKQSLVSRQLKELEEFFEVELTRRVGKALGLTPAGERLAALAREHLLALTDFTDTSRELAPTFHLGAGDSLLHWRVLPRLGAIRALLPRATLRLATSGPAAIASSLRELTLDFGVIRGDAARDLASESLGRIEYALYVPRRLVTAGTRKGGRRTALWVLGNVPLAVPDGDDLFTSWFDATLSAHGIAARVELECVTFPQACGAVASGHYAAILPTLARSELGKKTVAEVRSPLFAELATEVHLAWNPRLLRLRSAAEAARHALISALRV
ncbi:MAG: transcriptional regulator, LysR family [Myxococcaceae bacterium]|nr:transcriptional regulator, LysR family [Myxococcaceae bacterium]